ncbi:hypothetical protein K439DRAFT_1624577, partial [Ramaria rubella]
DGNLIYPKVYFDEHGAVQCSQWNRESILHEEPPFGHPILTQVVNTLTFQGHLLIALVAPDLFNQIPLPLIAPACTLVHFTLAHYVPGADSTKRMKFLVDDHTRSIPTLSGNSSSIILTYVLLHSVGFGTRIPDEESLDTITFSRGVSEAAIVAELAQLQQPPLPPQPEPHFMPPQQPSIFS